MGKPKREMSVAEAVRLVVGAPPVSDMAEQTQVRVADVLGRFASFSRTALGVTLLSEVDEAVAAAFVRSPTADGEVCVATQSCRRWVLRLFFRSLRMQGLAVGDPTLDLALTGLPPRTMRALSDDEVEVCRSFSMCSLRETRLPAVWALAEATGRTSEIGYVRIADIDLEGGTVLLQGRHPSGAVG